MSTLEAGAYIRHSSYPGVALVVEGLQMVDDEDTVWTGYQVPTGLVAVRMVGDDHMIHAEPEELSTLDRDDYCGACGQIGCPHDGRQKGDD